MKSEQSLIMNLEACYIYKDIVEEKKITYKNRDLAKLFSATIPYSLETIRMDNYFPDTFYIKNGKQYTRKVINLTFDKHYTVWDENYEYKNRQGELKKGKRKIVATKKKIRKYLYENGFVMDGVKYVFYKRGSGKAKNGYALYIQEELKYKLLLRSRLGLKFNKNELLDLTSLLAYESLVSSGIEFTIKLDPKTEILLIDDIYGKEFENLASVTREIDGKITTQNEKIKIKNCLTDGQGLLDESVFIEYKKQDKGFMLLRSDMFKDCGFNTKLQKWFKENNITELTDMFGNIYDASKIKLIITPNSLKFLKFAYKFTELQDKEKYNKLSSEEKKHYEKICYEYWLNNIDDVFGVVKCDKEGNYGTYNRTTYQLLNSIPTLTYDDLMEITKEEREYVMLLKNDNAVFRNYLCSDVEYALKIEQALKDENIELYENVDLLNALLLVNSDIQYTKKFKKMKSNLISNYIKYLKKGKIRLKDTKYVTIVSNPYEMLLAVIGKYNGQSIMQGREVYCQYYDDNQEFCVSRNPHINAGNVMFARNTNHEEYKWFNFTDNIMAVNFYDNDMPDRLQGEDTDSDTNLVMPHPILCRAAKYCETHFPTPINDVCGSSKLRKYNMAELQKLDVILSDNYIGKIINLSQIINSYLNDAIYNNAPSGVIQSLYNASSKLSSLSQIEIDKSKKVFDNVNMGKELSNIRKIPYLKYIEEKDKYGQMARKMIVPKFFSMISDFNEYRVFEEFNTPLDILQKALVFEGGKRLKGEKNKNFGELLVKSKELDGDYQTWAIDSVCKTIESCGKKINGLKIKTCILNEKAKKTVERKEKEKAVNKIKNLSLSEVTILNILKQCFEKRNSKFSNYGMLTLNILFIAKKIEVLKCFKNNNMKIDEILLKIKDNYDYNIFGNKYQKVFKSDVLKL